MTHERVFIPHHSEPIALNPRSPLLFLLQKIRDEAHRKAITFHRKRRETRLFTGPLDELKGIGPVKRTRLLRHFGSLKRIKEATEEELKAVPGINQKDIDTLKNLP